MKPAPMQFLERLAQHAADAPRRVAVREIVTDRSITYRQLHDHVTELATTLRERFAPGAVVMLRAPNVARFHAGFIAAFAAGMTIFPIPCSIVDAELRALVAKSNAAGIINETAIEAFDASAAASTNPALLLQSSGTTGLPK